VYTIDKNLPRWPMFVECVPSSGNASCVSRASRQNKMTIDIPRTPSAWGFLGRVGTIESGRVGGSPREQVRRSFHFSKTITRRDARACTNMNLVF